MKLAIAIPFSKRPPERYADELRECFQGAKVIASQPADSTAVRGPDKLIFHLNVTTTNAQRIADYANGIFRPLLLEAQNHGDAVLFMHENILPDAAMVERMMSMIERVPCVQFVSAKPRVWNGGTPEMPHAVVDYTSRFVLWRASEIGRWVTPFAVDPRGRAVMDEVMDRIEAAKDGSSFIWRDDMDVIER